MSRSSTRLHDQIVDLLTKAHTEDESMDMRINSLQQATEYLLYHNSKNERIDEFLETFLSMHADRSAPIRRFCAHFIEMLVFTRSRYACSCLDVLVTLLEDKDRQVVLFALRAARVVYKRALYWISVQQREAIYVQAANESVQVLDNLLARIVHLITSSSRDIFCESIRCAQTVVLCQSFSSFAPRSIAHLEAVGCGSLEELKLVDTCALDESKLNAQADRLFTALCALLVKNKIDDENFQLETTALIHAVGRIGHERSSYIGAATVAFSQLANDSTPSLHSKGVQSALICELRRILSSRHCVQWQPQIVPILNRLGVQTSEIVLAAEMDRMKDQIADEFGGSLKRQRNLDGQRLMKVSEMADSFKVPDEDHAAAVCSVRATSPAELASLALAMLARLGRKPMDPAQAIQRVVSDGAVDQRPTVGFEQKLTAIQTMGISSADFLTDTPDLIEENSDVEEEEEEQKIDELMTPPDISGPLASIGARNKTLFTKLVLGSITGDREEKIEHITRFFKNELSSNSVEGIVALFFAVNSSNSVISVEDLGTILIKCFANELQLIRQIIFEIPLIPSSLLEYLSEQVEHESAATRRWALTCISSLSVSKPGVSRECIEVLLRHCCSQVEAVRTDSLKLLVTKIYKPQTNVLLTSQWPYDAKKCSLTLTQSTRSSAGSKLNWIMSDGVEELAMKKVEEWVKGKADWENVWPFLALCSKKPVLLHFFFAHFLEHPGVVIPPELMTGFSTTLTMLPGDVIDKELELIVQEYKSVRAAGKKTQRNAFLLPILSAISNTQRGLTGTLADAALSFSK